MSFSTVISCLDGRIQLPVINYLQERFNTEYIDNITEAGPVGIIQGGGESPEFRSILQRVWLSIQAHGSRQLAIVALHDCAGNPRPDSEQISGVENSLITLAQYFPELEITGLWLDQNWVVHEIKTVKER
jgi:hypothetical protein